jgi:hypothetical protein
MAGSSRGAARRDTPDEHRIIDRFKRLGPQKRALAVTLRPFVDDDGRFDRRAWETAFSSDEPDVIAQVMAVTPAPLLVDAVSADGGLTANQAEVLKRLYRTRNELQHASLDVQADDVHEAIVLLDKSIGRLASNFVRWLERYDVRVLPSGS